MLTRRRRGVNIDALPESVYRYVDTAIVCIDVFLSSTTVVTAVAKGRRIVPAATVDDARARARGLPNPILASELGGPKDFDLWSGPVAYQSRTDLGRPLVLVSPVSQLMLNAQAAPAVYVACLRNMSATAELLAVRHERVALVGAGYAGEPRCEDQMVAAWIARELIERGFEPDGLNTAREVERWAHADLTLASLGRGAEYLRRLRQDEDLDFVMSRVDDLDLVCRYHAGEVRGIWLSPSRRMASSH